MDYFIHYLNTQGIIYYDWNVSAGDGASTAYTSEEIVENVTDDLWTIAKENHTTIQNIMETNHRKSEVLLAGEKVLIVKQVG